MKLASLLLAAAFALPAFAQQTAVPLATKATAPVAPDTPLIANGKVVITVDDFEANMLRIPENIRQESRANLDRVSQMSDNLFINRMLAEEARKQGIDKDPLVRARAEQLVDTLLAARFIEEYSAKARTPDLEDRAREIYASEPKRFRISESYDIDHLVVSLNGRTREMALLRAKEAERRIKAGEDFLEVARLYSEESRPRGTVGRLGTVTPGTIDPVLIEAAAALAVGAVSGPIASKSGFHLIRVNAKTAASQIPFKDAREAIIADERAKIAKKRIDDMVQGFRSDPATRVDKEAMEKLVQDIPREQIDKLLREQADKLKAAEDLKKAEDQRKAEAAKK